MMQSVHNHEEPKSEEFMTSMYETTIQELAEEVQKWKKNYSQIVYAMREEKEALIEIIREKNMEIRILTEDLRRLEKSRESRVNPTTREEKDPSPTGVDCIIDIYV